MTFFFTFIYLLNVEKPVHTCAMCRCERTTCGYHFSLLCGFQSSNSVCQAWLQAPLTTEPPRCPKSNFWKQPASHGSSLPIFQGFVTKLQSLPHTHKTLFFFCSFSELLVTKPLLCPPRRFFFKKRKRFISFYVYGCFVCMY